MSIRLHKDLGVNPRLVNYTCPVCGERASQEIALLGASNCKSRCPHCGIYVYGGKRVGDTCPGCNRGEGERWKREEISETEQIEGGVQVCQQCGEWMRAGIVFISVRDGESGDNPHRTGKLAVIKEEAVRKMVQPPEMLASVLDKRMCYLEDTVWTHLGLPEEETSGTKGSSLEDSQ
jgi:hypothetical protein